MVDAHQVQDRGVEVVDVDAVFGDVVAEVVSGAVAEAGFHMGGVVLVRPTSTRARTGRCSGGSTARFAIVWVIPLPEQET